MRPSCSSLSFELQLIDSIDLKNEGKVSKGPAKKAGEYSLHDVWPSTAAELHRRDNEPERWSVYLSSPDSRRGLEEDLTHRHLHPVGRWKAERPEGFHDRSLESQGQRHASGKSMTVGRMAS